MLMLMLMLMLSPPLIAPALVIRSLQPTSLPTYPATHLHTL
jgi:hypothetical protein